MILDIIAKYQPSNSSLSTVRQRMKAEKTSNLTTMGTIHPHPERHQLQRAKFEKTITCSATKRKRQDHGNMDAAPESAAQGIVIISQLPGTETYEVCTDLQLPFHCQIN
jgi:hypothetical protein